MIATCVMVYLGVWLLTGLGMFVAGRMLADPDRPAEKTFLISFGAGVAWPLLLLGALELCSVALYARVISRRTPLTVPEAWVAAESVNIVGRLN